MKFVFGEVWMFGFITCLEQTGFLVIDPKVVLDVRENTWWSRNTTRPVKRAVPVTTNDRTTTSCYLPRWSGPCSWAGWCSRGWGRSAPLGPSTPRWATPPPAAPEPLTCRRRAPPRPPPRCHRRRTAPSPTRARPETWPLLNTGHGVVSGQDICTSSVFQLCRVCEVEELWYYNPRVLNLLQAAPPKLLQWGEPNRDLTTEVRTESYRYTPSTQD